MRRLYLIRHAKSSWSEAGLRDFDRPLNSRGKVDAPYMGKRLAAHGVRPDLIFASPAKRTRKTAQYIAEAVDYPVKDIVFFAAIYEAGVADLLRIIGQAMDEAGCLFLIGHNFAIYRSGGKSHRPESWQCPDLRRRRHRVFCREMVGDKAWQRTNAVF